MMFGEHNVYLNCFIDFIWVNTNTSLPQIKTNMFVATTNTSAMLQYDVSSYMYEAFLYVCNASWSSFLCVKYSNFIPCYCVGYRMFSIIAVIFSELNFILVDDESLYLPIYTEKMLSNC